MQHFKENVCENYTNKIFCQRYWAVEGDFEFTLHQNL